MSKIYLEIKADWNDADYVTEKSRIKEKDLPRIKRICKYLKQNSSWIEGHDFDEDEFCKNTGEEDIEWFDAYVPSGYETSCHSIDEISIIYVEKEQKLV